MLRAEGLRLAYGPTQALVDASVEVGPAESVALVGPSGSGKSSILHCLAGLLQPDGGAVEFHGEPLPADDDLRSDLRRERFGFVFQFAELVPELTLRENIALPLHLNRVPRGEVRRRVAEIVEALGLEEHADRRPARVSGGQAQRAALGRAVAHRPSVIFADEPTGSLDAENGTVALDVMLRLAREEAAALLLVTHDPAIAARADHVVQVVDGRTVPTR
jgi:putative ABC transport system ATP-binding protein